MGKGNSSNPKITKVALTMTSPLRRPLPWLTDRRVSARIGLTHALERPRGPRQRCAGRTRNSAESRLSKAGYSSESQPDFGTVFARMAVATPRASISTLKKSPWSTYPSSHWQLPSSPQFQTRQVQSNSRSWTVTNAATDNFALERENFHFASMESY